MNVRGVKGKAKKRKPTKPDNPAQSAKFIAAAKELGIDGKGKEFEKAIENMLKTKPRSD